MDQRKDFSPFMQQSTTSSTSNVISHRQEHTEPSEHRPCKRGGIVTFGLAWLDLWPLFSTMTKISYAGYRSPPLIIQQAIWLYVRFTLSFREVKDLLAERGIVTYETVRRWVNHFGPKIAADLRKRRPKPHTIWNLRNYILYN